MVNFQKVIRALIIRYGDGAGNTTEENSSVFSLIRIIECASCLQCFDAVGWAARRESAKKYGGWWRSALVSPDGYWTTRGYANSRTANSRPGHLAYWSTRGLDNSQTSQLADWTTRRYQLCGHKVMYRIISLIYV